MEVRVEVFCILRHKVGVHQGELSLVLFFLVFRYVVFLQKESLFGFLNLPPRRHLIPTLSLDLVENDPSSVFFELLLEVGSNHSIDLCVDKHVFGRVVLGSEVGSLIPGKLPGGSVLLIQFRFFFQLVTSQLLQVFKRNDDFGQKFALLTLLKLTSHFLVVAV